MSLVYCHRLHRYVDRGKRTELTLQPAGAYDLPDGLALKLVDAHPSKLCLLSDGSDPSKHKCETTKVVKAEELLEAERRELIATTHMEKPVMNTRFPSPTRISAQKRVLLKQAQKRSRIARVATRGGSS